MLRPPAMGGRKNSMSKALSGGGILPGRQSLPGNNRLHTDKYFVRI
jgi:hypothetical protein